MDVTSTVKNVPVSRARARAIVLDVLRAEKVRNALVSVAFVSSRAMARLNREYLDHPRTTDVIAFGLGRETAAAPVIGDIYISPEVARRNARELGLPVRNELERLIVHGTLHVLGYEHPDDDARTRSRMWRRQEEILGRRR